jgi:glycosyl hydrolase family 16
MEDHFAGEALDTEVWLPYYLPHWSSRASSAATYRVGGGELRLSIPPEQGLWCEDRHDGPLRVSGIQSASFSGPVGSPVGGQPFRDGLLVASEEPEFRGYTPLYGQIEVRARGVLSPRSMMAFWLAGLEDEPRHSGEICVMEIFGDAVRPGSADVGIGLHEFRDPDLTEQWSTVPLDLDVTDFHTYAVDWQPGSLVFTVDGAQVRRIDQSPNYPVQLMLAVFDFPGQARPGDEVPVPELIVSHVRGS